ncbi:MAG: phage protease [Puniceicoccales bacterium]|nr:phage protease [Puniceicoccales bacterium]
MDETALNQWVKLLPYGNYPHPKGMQHFSRSSAEIIVKNFKSLRGRLSRKFLGLPIFIGHPDDNTFSGRPGHKSHVVYGRVKDLEPKVDGMWLLIHWSTLGYQLIKNGFFKFLSPRWRMKILANNDFEPIKLLSLGLTNNPNIKTCRLIDQPSFVSLSDGEKLAKLMKSFGVNELVDFEEQLISLKSLGEDSEKWKNQCKELIDENKKLQAEIENFYQVIQTHGLQNQKNVTSSEQITKNATDGDQDSIPLALGNLNTQTKTMGLNHRTKCFYEKKDKILTLVQERMAATGDRYNEAWAWAKRSNPSLFID